MDLLVVGAGEMGRWFAGSVASVADVAFADRDPDAATAAADSVGGRAVALDGDETFDAVCFAVPMTAAAESIAAHADRSERAVLDVTGVMSTPLAAMREHAPECERVSTHPLFSSENAPGNVAVVAERRGPVTDDLLAALTAEGNDCFETTAEEHDDAMETVQAKTHAAVLAYALAADDVDERFHTSVSGPLSELVEEMTGNTPRVYAEVQGAFDGAEAVAEAARRIAEADEETFERLYRECS